MDQIKRLARNTPPTNWRLPISFQGVYLQMPLMTWHFPPHFQSHPTEQIAEAYSKNYVVIHGSAVPL